MELQELKQQIQLLSDPSSPHCVGRLLQLRRQVLLLQFDTAVRHLGRSVGRFSLFFSGRLEALSFSRASIDLAGADPESAFIFFHWLQRGVPLLRRRHIPAESER